MIEFRTDFSIPKFPFEITHSDSLILLGSCFSEKIGIKLKNESFKTNINPFGIMFNPVSIANIITKAINGKTYSENDFLEHDGKKICFDFQYKSNGIVNSLPRANENLSSLAESLKKARVLFITLGSSWVYRYKRTGKIVANCHKVPQTEFSKELLPVNSVVNEVERTIELLNQYNKELKVVFSVSPVRHLKDGIHENQLSKSTLLLAVNVIVKAFDNCYYFPSYEIIMDDLRDYRFFKRDLIHPNTTAVDYIWEKFKTAFFSQQTKELAQKIKKLNKTLQHIPNASNDKAYQLAKKDALLQLKALQKVHDFEINQ